MTIDPEVVELTAEVVVASFWWTKVLHEGPCNIHSLID